MNTIENKYLKLAYNMHGGSMSSIFSKEFNEEFQYQKDERAWTSQDIVIFPFVGRLKDKTYLVDGKEFHMKNHGLTRYYDLKEFEKKEDEVTLLFKSNEETLKEYPFDFSLFVNYKLDGKKVCVSYKVLNDGDKTMYFGIGAHPGFRIPCVEEESGTNTDGNFISFGKKIGTKRITMDEAYEFVEGEEDFEINEKFEVSKSFFKNINTFILDSKGMNEVTLERKDGHKVLFRFNSNYIAFWTNPTFGDYVCIEPWDSIPDMVERKEELKEKKSIISLEKGKEYTFSYSFEIM